MSDWLRSDTINYFGSFSIRKKNASKSGIKMLLDGLGPVMQLEQIEILNFELSAICELKMITSKNEELMTLALLDYK